MTDIAYTEAAEAAASDLRLLVVPTDADDEGYDRARAAALDVARRAGCAVVLHDRSDERWTDTPHPEGPFGPDEVDAERREHLPAQMAPFTDAGIEVKAWYASVPAVTEILNTVQTLEADAILVPESIENPKMMDRLQAGDDTGEQVGRVLDQNLDRPVRVFVIDDDGTLEVMTTVDNTERPEAPDR